MDTQTLADLVRAREYPAVSVLMPTHRHAPENQQDPIRLRNLLTEARRRLRDDELVSEEVADDVLKSLETAAAEVDLNHAEDGLALFAAPGGEHHSYLLAQTVEERVVIDETFLTRNVVAALTGPSTFWVLTVSDKHARLWDGHREHLTEVTTGGFPMTHEVPLGAVDKSGRIVPRPHNDERHRQFMRDVDRALGAILAKDARSVVLVGLKQNLVVFDDVAANAGAVIGTVEGGHDGAPGHELLTLVQPVLEADIERRQRAALLELDAARNGRRYAAGLDEVWQLARQGRGAHLVVENGYRTQARVYDDHLVIAEGDSADTEDAVDDVIEIVLTHGGEVTFVPDYMLADHDRIALVARY
jgi:Bacterial archaeo-eukaryotic release factor family 3